MNGQINNIQQTMVNDYKIFSLNEDNVTPLYETVEDLLKAMSYCNYIESWSKSFYYVSRTFGNN